MSHSGLVRSLGKRVWVKPPEVRILSSPQGIKKSAYADFLLFLRDTRGFEGRKAAKPTPANL